DQNETWTETNPARVDSDGDGINDGVEDADQDGVVDTGETDPRNPDTDGDGLSDGVEDADQDGVVDTGETDPRSTDTDGDCYKDNIELDMGSLPTNGGSTPDVPTPSASNMVINEIHAKPDVVEGDANGDGVLDIYDDEFIELVNISNVYVDLSDYELHDVGVGLRHIFSDSPLRTIVPPGEAVVVFGDWTGTLSGTFGNAMANGLVFKASTGTLGLNNSGDIVDLKDSGGSTTILSQDYGSEANHDQSITLYPDKTGTFVKHLDAPSSGGRRFSPGTMVNGDPFTTTISWIFPIRINFQPSSSVTPPGYNNDTAGEYLTSGNHYGWLPQ
ncbi:unnamed protein product, partial [marine sediment metagenome]